MIKRKERESMAMTYKKLKEIIERNGVPEDVHLMSNSGWECKIGRASCRERVLRLV